MGTYIPNTSYNQNTRLNIFYFSDYHGNIPAYRNLKEASDEFDSKHKNENTLKLSGGDLTAGNDPPKRILLYRLLKLMNLDASAVGNHEWDNGTDFYSDINKLFNNAPNLLFNNFVACNSISPNDNVYKQEGLFQSKIITKNNQKYGVIGAITNDHQLGNCKVDDIEKTKQDIYAEVQKLKAYDPTLNKIIFLSHLGLDNDKIIAQSVSDLDIIIGGHTHNVINGVVQGQNLFLSPKNEPVLIVQAGNEKAFGELSVDFDSYGRIDLSRGHEPVNTAKSIYNFKEDVEVKELEDKILQPSPYLGVLNKTIKPNNHLTEENPLGNLLGDAFIYKTGADIGISNAGTFRSFINAGQITERNIEYCIPFSNPVITVKLTGKDIADLIKLGAASTSDEHANPGLYQVAGLKYNVTPDKKVKNLYIADKNGNKILDIIDDKGNLVQKNASKEFKVALTEHLVKEAAKRGVMANYAVTENGKTKIDVKLVLNKYDDQRKVLIDYLRSEFTNKNKPIDVDIGRIAFENANKPNNIAFLSLINTYKL